MKTKKKREKKKTQYSLEKLEVLEMQTFGPFAETVSLL